MGMLKQVLTETRAFRTLSWAFGEMVCRRSELSGENEADSLEALEILAAATLEVTQDNHSCLFLDEWCQMQLKNWEEKQRRLQEKGGEAPALSYAQLETLLADWRGVCLGLKTTALEHLQEGKQEATAPLVLVESPVCRVYLNRFYRYEREIAELVRQRVNGVPMPKEELLELATQIPRSSRHFAGRCFETDDQMQAIANVLQSRFAIVTGGPGRGKTTVLTEILAFELRRNPELKIALSAPTGKAAARMKQAVNAALMCRDGKESDLNLAIFGQSVFEKLGALRPSTVHSLLGIAGDTDIPRVNGENPLDYDLVAVDECSMMSLQLFAQLLQALKPEAKLILLGDENQLASVDEGTVLSELCHSGYLNALDSPKVINRLVVNHRSQANARLCAYTDAIVTEGQRPDVDGLYSEGVREGGVFRAFELARVKPREQLEAFVQDGLKMAGVDEAWKNLRSVEEAFEVMESFKLLTPVREGNYGVSTLNGVMRKLLDKKDSYEDGVPVMVCKNDSVTELKNGDIGVCYKRYVYFKMLKNDGTEVVKTYTPAQLPPHECAFAMTIHKSQGSDYANVLMVLPDKDNPILTRELIYTGISRTKLNFRLLANRELLEKAQGRKTERWSGLGYYLK